jgi:ubiquinone/menaquinone biosynthesis C-methylase UbiE
MKIETLDPFPLYGPDQLALFDLLAQAIDPERLIPAAMSTLAPYAGCSLLDIGAGVGDRTIVYAQSAAHVYALEPDASILPVLRGRIKSSGVSNVTVLPGSVEDIALEDGRVEVAYATWSYFFGPGSERGLSEVERVLCPGGMLIVVQNHGHDEIANAWTEDEAECESWSPWFADRGFQSHIVDTVWRFKSPEEALAVMEFLWGEAARAYVLGTGKAEFQYKVAIYHRQFA